MRFLPNETDKARLAQKYHTLERKTVDIPLRQRSRPRPRTQSIISTVYVLILLYKSINFYLIKIGLCIFTTKRLGFKNNIRNITK
jgi:hypothetical protein